MPLSLTNQDKKRQRRGLFVAVRPKQDSSPVGAICSISQAVLLGLCFGCECALQNAYRVAPAAR